MQAPPAPQAPVGHRIRALDLICIMSRPSACDHTDRTCHAFVTQNPSQSPHSIVDEAYHSRGWLQVVLRTWRRGRFGPIRGDYRRPCHGAPTNQSAYGAKSSPKTHQVGDQGAHLDVSLDPPELLALRAKYDAPEEIRRPCSEYCFLMAICTQGCCPQVPQVESHRPTHDYL
jgi:hypothetical protein